MEGNDVKNWSATWITDGRFAGLNPLQVLHKADAENENYHHADDLKNQHMLVRKTFETGTCRPAWIDISGDDYYKLYINGKFVGQGPAPSYHFAYNYNRFDVEEYLREGENVIAVHVYYQGEINRVWNSGDYRQGMICELWVDGVLAAASDSSWRYARAREFCGTDTTGFATYYLENIDNRLRQSGWKEPGFDDSAWDHVCEKPDHDYTFQRQITPPVQVYAVRPKSVERLGTDAWLIDFGKEITGSLGLSAEGARGGEKIRLLYGEELEGGHVRYDMRCKCKYEEELILAKGPNGLENFDYKAFRYAEVIDPAGCVDHAGFFATVRHYPIAREAVLETSSGKLDAIWKICANGVRCGAQEGYLDCPTREKGQYLGDLTITANAQIYLSGDLRMYKKALVDFAHSARICPGFMAVAPGSFMQEIADFSLLWPHQLLTYYRHTGDRAFLSEMYPYAQGIVDYFKRFARADGLLENVTEKWNLVDWPEPARDGYDFTLKPGGEFGCHNVLNAFYYGAVKNLQEIREILELPADPRECRALKDAFIAAFYHRETGLFTDTETSAHSAFHANVLPLYFDLTPDTERAVRFIREKGMCCSVYFSYFLLKALTNHGQHKLAYELITSEGLCSWYNMVREGASCCFEAWGKEMKWNTSLCHPWASSPVIVLVEDIFGIRRQSPGGDFCLCEPHIPEELTSVRLDLPDRERVLRFRHEKGHSALEKQ